MTDAGKSSLKVLVYRRKKEPKKNHPDRKGRGIIRSNLGETGLDLRSDSKTEKGGGGRASAKKKVMEGRGERVRI